MNHKILSILLAALALPTTAGAQAFDRSKYPDYSTKVNPDPSLMQVRSVGRAAAVRPDHVNNADTRYFPPVFYQAGGSCGSASRICYMFSHELNSYRDLDGKNPKNYYPSHFVWLLTNGNSGKDEFVQYVGVPSAATYGGQTYSKLFGSQDATANDFGWMTGYDKWLEAMGNRMLRPVHFSENVGTEEGREALKNWLWNHNGDTDFHSGGVVGIGCGATGMQLADIAQTPANDEVGATGKKFLKKWGTLPDHAMTIVGYDDRIEFDLNGNGIYGEASADERGAWILVNSWGTEWGNNGFVYCPYAYAGATFNANGTFTGNWWSPEVYHVRKNYRPLRTIKLRMDYSARSELYLKAGVAKDLNATAPEYTQAFDHFKYAGDGNYGNTDPAPDVPMLGRWVDGKLHSEPMEFGYDLTDLTDNLDPNDALKYFFIIETKKDALGFGHVYDASILDYDQDPQGLEIPFATGTNGVTIENQGGRTVMTVIVPGRGIKSPQNVSIADGTLAWSAPAVSGYTLTGYKVYKGADELATLAPSVLKYELPADASGTYAVQAIYGEKSSAKIAASVPVAADRTTTCVALNHTGLTLPDVFTSKYDQATIEFWIRPQSLLDWNQSAGPGWGTFMMHANANGTFTAGWDTSNRLNVTSALRINNWTHIALVVDHNKMTAYVNGSQRATITSQSYSGIGGFGDLVWSSNGNQNDQHSYMQDIRIWKTARTAEEIRDNYMMKLADGFLPDDLVAYYRGDLIDVDDTQKLHDRTRGAHHGTFANANFADAKTYARPIYFGSKTFASIVLPTGTTVVGQPVTIKADASLNIQSLRWTAPGAGVENLSVTSPVMTFAKSGAQPIHLVVTDMDGKQVEADTTLTVEESQAPDAAFTISKSTVATGDRVTFIPNQMPDGTRYKWSMPGASVSTSTHACVTVSYAQSGTYNVTLTVTDAQGRTHTTQQTIHVAAVAPKAAFDVNPAVVMKGETVSLSNQSLYHASQCQWTLISPQTAMQGTGRDITFTPTVPGIYDVTLLASNSAGSSETTQSHALVVCNADSKTGLSFSPAATARVTATSVPFTSGQTAFSMDWWMRANSLQAACNGIGDAQSTFQLQTISTGQLRVYVGGKYAKSVDGFIIPNEWHHYAVTFYMGYVVFFRDGEIICRGSVNATSLPAMCKFAFGSDDAPMCGTIDEFRVWSTAFNENRLDVLHGYITAPMDADAVRSAEVGGLKLYYQFNQNGGNVEDATSNHNTGVRSGFGPDGDAWSDSKGVFALCFDGGAKNVTQQYLANPQSPFENTGEVFSDAYPNRFMTLKDWTIENLNTEKYNTGAHVDVNRSNYLCITTGQDGFESALDDHKLYQTLSLPAGAYVLAANFGDYEGDADNCYLVAALGTGLPDTKQLSTAVAYKTMESKPTVSQNTLFFVLTEPSTVSLGVLANMAGEQCMAFQSFTLTQYPLTPMEDLVDGIHTIDTPATINATTSSVIYDLTGRRISIPTKGVYIIGGKKVVR